MISGRFGAAAFTRAAKLVPRAEQWKPDLVVHPVTELAGAVAAARTGIADFVTHAMLLPHCAGLVTQGGASTNVAALCHGLPRLILPHDADQFANPWSGNRLTSPRKRCE